MARKKRHGRGVNPVRKWARRGLSLLASVVAGVAAAGPAIKTYSEVGMTDAFPERLVANYTGFEANTGTFNADRLKQAVFLIAGGVAAAMLIRFASKRV